MKILGVDQSLSATGWCILENGHCIDTGVITVKDTGTVRLAMIRDAICKQIRDHEISLFVREDYAYGATGRATFSLGELGGVLDVMARDHDCRRWAIPPTSWKKLLLGQGNVPKDTAYLLYFRDIGLDFRKDAEADAYGLAWYLHIRLKLESEPQLWETLTEKQRESLLDSNRMAKDKWTMTKLKKAGLTPLTYLTDFSN